MAMYRLIGSYFITNIGKLRQYFLWEQVVFNLESRAISVQSPCMYARIGRLPRL
jgi:hypothetical protein